MIILTAAWDPAPTWKKTNYNVQSKTFSWLRYIVNTFIFDHINLRSTELTSEQQQHTY